MEKEIKCKQETITLKSCLERIFNLRKRLIETKNLSIITLNSFNLNENIKEACIENSSIQKEPNNNMLEMINLELNTINNNLDIINNNLQVIKNNIV